MTNKHTFRTAYSEGYEDGWYRSTRIGGRSSDPFWEEKDWVASRTARAPEMAAEIQRLKAQRDTLLEAAKGMQRCYGEMPAWALNTPVHDADAAEAATVVTAHKNLSAAIANVED